MSYQRIQQVLEADSMFASQVVDKNAEVSVRSGEKVKMAALVVNCYDALKTTGCNMQSVSRTTILATAARLTSGGSVPLVAPVPSVVSAMTPPKTTVKKPTSKTESKPQQSTTKPVVVTTARAGTPRPITIERPIDTETIHRYQCAVAGAQLLAALHQLFEKDDYPGHEQRKKKLDDLISEVEQSSSTHVNLSVKAIIRAQTSTKQTPG